MNYFVKFLPVEGEIKEGETGISVNNTTYTHYNHLGKDYGKPARLFLCSRDIQIGEKCYHEKHIALGPTTTKNEDNSSFVFKVIGEISKDALWMKVFYEERKKDLPTIFVHSMNPVGTEKIKNLFI